MVFLKLPSFKLGQIPSIRSQFDLNKLTGTQKLDLISSRIFGHNIGNDNISNK